MRGSGAGRAYDRVSVLGPCEGLCGIEHHSQGVFPLGGDVPGEGLDGYAVGNAPNAREWIDARDIRLTSAIHCNHKGFCGWGLPPLGGK